LLNDLNNQKEIHLINKLNLAIKITVFILFGLTVLNIGLVIFMVKTGVIYSDDMEDPCETWEQTFSCTYDEDYTMNTKGFYIYSIFIIICLGIIFSCAFSIYFSIELKDKMTLYCSFELGEDYDIDSWNISKVFLYIITSLYSVEILLCLYSICFGVRLLIKERRRENQQNKNILLNKTYLNK